MPLSRAAREIQDRHCPATVPLPGNREYAGRSYGRYHRPAPGTRPGFFNDACGDRRGATAGAGVAAEDALDTSQHRSPVSAGLFLCPGRSHNARAMAQDIYLDESSQTGHRYLVIGGLALPTESVYGMVGVIREARKPKLPRGEMKWGKVSAAKFDAYKNVVDAFFDLNEQNKIHFHCLIAASTFA